MYIASGRRVNCFFGISGGIGRSNRVRDVDELVLDREALGDQLAQSPDPERLGRVVAARQEMDAVLPRFAHDRLARLAGDEGVQSHRARLVKSEPTGPRDDPDARDPLRPAFEDQGLLTGGVLQAPAELAHLDGLRGATDQAHGGPLRLTERAIVGLEPQGVAEQRVVADLGMGVEGQVVGGQRDVGAEQGPKASRHRHGQRGDIRSPEQAVVGDHELRTRLHCALQALEVRRHPRGDLVYLGLAGHLEPVRTVVLERIDFEQLVAEAEDVLARGHRSQPNYHAAMNRGDASVEPGTDPFIQSLMETDLYSIGAFFCDQNPELVDEVVERSEAIESRGLESWAPETETPVEECFRTLLTGLAVRYYKAVAG